VVHTLLPRGLVGCWEVEGLPPVPLGGGWIGRGRHPRAFHKPCCCGCRWLLGWPRAQPPHMTVNPLALPHHAQQCVKITLAPRGGTPFPPLLPTPCTAALGLLMTVALGGGRSRCWRVPKGHFAPPPPSPSPPLPPTPPPLAPRPFPTPWITSCERAPVQPRTGHGEGPAAQRRLPHLSRGRL
jgi:hypothetical protein